MTAVWSTSPWAAEHGGKDTVDYGHDLISVATGQQNPIPTGNCIVWVNAEGLGVGPAQLGGYHGLTMNIDLKPIGKDSPKPSTFATGLADMQKRFPTAPGWLVKILQKNETAIEAACVQDHEAPVVIHKITGADKRS